MVKGITTVYIDAEILEKARKYCKKNRKYFSTLIEECLKDVLKIEDGAVVIEGLTYQASSPTLTIGISGVPVSMIQEIDKFALDNDISRSEIVVGLLKKAITKTSQPIESYWKCPYNKPDGAMCDVEIDWTNIKDMESKVKSHLTEFHSDMFTKEMLEEVISDPRYPELKDARWNFIWKSQKKRVR